jgi:hypothetical protein
MATATPAKSKTRDNKITRLILPALYDAGSAGLTINEVVDPRTGKPVEALYFYDAANPEKNDGKALIEQTTEPVRTGLRGRPARRWKLTKSTRDRITKQRKRAAAKVEQAEPVAA